MKGVVVMISMLLVGCTPPRGLDDVRNRFEESSAAYRRCMNTVDGDHTCEPQRRFALVAAASKSTARKSGHEKAI
jgi:hypothetical protein